MKKYFLVWITLVLTVMPSIVLAEADRNYLNGDKNYIFCGASMGAGYFVDRTSLVVEKYEPPIYILSIEVCSVGHYFDKFGEKTFRRGSREIFKYDYSSRTMYLYTPDENHGQWLKERYVNHYRGRNDNVSREKLRRANEIDWDSEWTYVDPDVFYGEGAVFTTAGEIAFARAYNLKFHGSKYKRFEGDFYDKIGDIKDRL